MSDGAVYTPSISAPAEERSVFLRRAATWTAGGLLVTAIASIASMLFVVPAVFQGGKWAVIGVVYGCFFGTQMLARKMVYGESSKVAGFFIGETLQGVALGFLLSITLMMGSVSDGLKVIGYAMLMTLLSSLAMLAYVSIEKREFSLLRASLSVLFVPMLLLMGLQLVLPMDGTFGLVIAAVFLVVSAAAMLWKLNFVLHEMPVTMPLEAGFEISIGIVVLFWNLLSLMNRLRRR